ncbi:type II toxin-antitoxin system RelE/ParE family toxin, partial [Butyricimonas virosa]|uniref:type II toxin-antitoxin system RelE/ParE family toxin n=2 Tax=Butyricimonas virosa TaxID=544645 RepID=UPI00242D41E0
CFKSSRERGRLHNRRREKLYRRTAWMEIIWTKKAIESFKELAFYLNSSFGKDIAVSIVGKVTRRATDLLRNPLLGKVYESSNLLKYEFRFFVINKQTKVFYFIQGEFVYIVLVFDVRQDIRRIHEMLSSIK